MKKSTKASRRRLSSLGTLSSPPLEENDDASEQKEHRRLRRLSEMDEMLNRTPMHSPSGAGLGSPFSPHAPAGETPSKRRLIASPFMDAAREHKIVEKKDEKATAHLARLAHGELSEMYANCIKLSAENKISVKNTWQLNLIDYIDDVLKTAMGDEQDNFQVASCTLDASVKIYSCRVDSVYSEAYKIMGGLTRTRKKGSGSGDDDEDGEEESSGDESDGEGKKRKGKRKKGRKGSDEYANTLERVPESLLVKKFDLEFDTDPLFSKMSRTFDAGGVSGMLLHNLPMSNALQIIFDSSETREETPPMRLRVDIGADAEMGKKKAGNEMFSAPQFWDVLERIETYTPKLDLNGMKAGKSKPIPRDEAEQDMSVASKEQEEERGEEEKGDVNIAKDHMDNVSDDVSDDASDGEDDVGMGPLEDALEIDLEMNLDLDAGMESDVEAGGWKDPEGVDIDADMPIERRDADAGGIRLSVSRDDATAFAVAWMADGDEYSYFDESKMKNWAGPSHWKFRTRRGAALLARDTAAVEEQTDAEGKIDTLGDSSTAKTDRKKRRKAGIAIDFSTDAPEDAMRKAFSKPKRRTALLMAEPKTSDNYPGGNDPLLLPEDVQYSVKDLLKLFLKPSFIVGRRRNKPVKRKENGDAEDGYSYGNDLDANGFVAPGDAGDDVWEADDDDDDVTAGGGGGVGTDDDGMPIHGEHAPARVMTYATTSAFGGDALLEAPRTVNVIEVKHETKARTVDVLSLKETIWDEVILSGGMEPPDASESTTEMEGISSLRAPERISEETSFKAVVEKIPGPDPNDRARQAVSVPLCFICLLHLANEKHLHLEGSEDLKNVRIFSD
eukprot:TRINITY_DN850_c1_g1_i1.p1 TRINITY_DN850_c1_g1~~TRINITY_DN850_c1_g1_i1.p1  ORF type:complete len:879 (+),score=315.59 TRINITY_DN850_c1_g1_i1:112-2637(+)